MSEQPPYELSYVWRCQRWGAPLLAGPVEDWFLAEVVNMEAAVDTFNAFKSRDEAQKAGIPATEWSGKHPAWAEFCFAIDELRRLSN